MERKTKVIISVVIISLFATSLVVTGVIIYNNTPSLTLNGSLYFNDSGEHHGGFEMAMQWNITLVVKGIFGHFVVTPEPGYSCNDVLLKWSYAISGLQISEENITMAIDGHPVVLEFVENDTIWNRYDDHYISSTPDLSPTIFPGFLSHYYVELRLAETL
jgi:hypothetical protein